MTTDERDYFSVRAEQESHMATVATNPSARAAHHAMACAYRARALGYGLAKATPVPIIDTSGSRASI